MRTMHPRAALRPHRGGWVVEGPGFYVFEEDPEQARRLGTELAGAGAPGHRNDPEPGEAPHARARARIRGAHRR